jgi:hypothetical protein
LTHAGYLFLYNLNITNLKENLKKNGPPAFVAIFIISIVQVAFLFFLANSVTRNTAVFTFWLTLTIIMALSGLIFIKLIIAGNRVAPEWIMLYAFTVGFLITISLTLLEANKLQQDEERLFNVTVLGVLLARAFLDYVIGEGFYFPEK